MFTLSFLVLKWLMLPSVSSVCVCSLFLNSGKSRIQKVAELILYASYSMTFLKIEAEHCSEEN